MTNKYNNWERIELLLKYLNLSANAFALSIGLARSENIYHIKRGNYGISYDLAERIVAVYPDINPTWLLSGVGDMLQNARNQYSSVPFFEGDIEEVLRPDAEIKAKALGRYRVPFQCDCEMVVRSLTKAMITPGTASTDLFLKRVTVDEVIQGNEYVVALGDRVLWRKIRMNKDDAGQWRLVSMDKEVYPDIIINKSDIRVLWRVIARMSILVS